MKVLERGGVRVAFEGDEIAVYVDPDELMAISQIDLPEVEIIRFSKEDAGKEWGRFVKNVKAEWRRFNRRRKAPKRKVGDGKLSIAEAGRLSKVIDE